MFAPTLVGFRAGKKVETPKTPEMQATIIEKAGPKCKQIFMTTNSQTIQTYLTDAIGISHGSTSLNKHPLFHDHCPIDIFSKYFLTTQTQNSRPISDCLSIESINKTKY